MEAKTGRKDMQVAVATAHKWQERSVITVLELAYFMAKKNLPSESFSDLKHLPILQVGFITLHTITIHLEANRRALGGDNYVKL